MKKYLLLILALASFLRLWQLGQFPNGLNADEAAIGYSAYSLIQTGQDELEDARWFTREEMRDSLRQGTLGLAFGLAISFHLIESWFDAGDLGSLRDISTGW